MKRLCVLFYFILFALNTYSQTIQPFVVNASGGIIQNDKLSLNWSLGELAVTTIGTPNNLLTQGFLQPLIAPITGISNEFSNGDIINSNLSYFPRRHNDTTNTTKKLIG